MAKVVSALALALAIGLALVDGATLPRTRLQQSLQQQLQRQRQWELIQAQRARQSLAQIHETFRPNIKSVQIYAAYHLALQARLNDANQSIDTIDPVQLAKQAMQDAFQRTPASTRRDATQAQEDEFISGVKTELSTAALSLLSHCLIDIADDVISLYTYDAGSNTPSDLQQILNNIASTMATCVPHTDEAAWDAIQHYLESSAHADAIWASCQPLVTELASTTFDEYKVGQLTGSCLATINTGANARRSVTPSSVPATWTCTPAYYNATDGCDVGCGAFDPDCAFNPRRTFFPLGRPEVPAAWNCPPGFFGSGDGCDLGCGTADPDCGNAGESRRLTSYTWGSSDFDIQALKVYESVRLDGAASPYLAAATATNSNSNDSSHMAGVIAGAVVGAVVGAALVVLVGLVVIRRRQAGAGVAMTTGEAPLLTAEDREYAALPDVTRA